MILLWTYLCADLVAALAGLYVDDFSHLERVLCVRGGLKKTLKRLSLFSGGARKVVVVEGRPVSHGTQLSTEIPGRRAQPFLLTATHTSQTSNYTAHASVNPPGSLPVGDGGEEGFFQDYGVV